VQQDVFMKVNGKTFVGKVWPNEAAYPDFTAPKAESWWGQQLDSF
jgi:alpha-glucosidase (family GH31 glycosyl hydrolase)